MSDCGVIYLVLDRPIFMQLCMLSMMSLRKSGYTGQIAVVTNLTAEAWSRAASLFEGPQPGHRLIDCACEKNLPRKTYKTRLDRLTPFCRTLYLDCDTIVCGDIAPIWNLVAGRPIALALDRAPTIKAARQMAPSWGDPADWQTTIAVCGENASHYNSGVLYWENTPQAHELFSHWESETNKFGTTDQIPLLRAIALSGCPIAQLASIYNSQGSRRCGDNSAVIRHFSGTDADNAKFQMYALYHRCYLDRFKKPLGAIRNVFEKGLFSSGSRIDSKGLGNSLRGEEVQQPATPKHAL